MRRHGGGGRLSVHAGDHDSPSLIQNGSQRLGAKNHPFSKDNHPIVAYLLQDEVVRTVRPALWTLLVAVAFVLLIACVNVASLLLVRAEARQREIAIRNALGAARIRLVRQFVTEGLVLVVAGTAIGLLGSYWMMQILLRLIPADMLAQMPFLDGLGLHLRVLGFAGGIAALAVFLCGETAKSITGAAIAIDGGWTAR